MDFQLLINKLKIFLVFPLVPRIMKILRIRAFILMLIQVETRLKNKESKIKLTM